MSTTMSGPLTAADIEQIDIEELMRGIFASDVPLKKILKRGIKQIEHTERVAKANKKAEKVAKSKKGKKRAKKAQHRMENAAVNLHTIRAVANTVGAGVCIGSGIMIPGVNVMLFGLGGTQSLRAAREGVKIREARKVRKQLRKGKIAIPTREQDLRAKVGNARFETLLALSEAGFMGYGGFVGNDKVAKVCTAIQLLVSGWYGSEWSQNHDALAGMKAARKIEKAHAEAEAAEVVEDDTLLYFVPPAGL